MWAGGTDISIVQVASLSLESGLRTATFQGLPEARDQEMPLLGWWWLWWAGQSLEGVRGLPVTTGDASQPLIARPAF